MGFLEEKKEWSMASDYYHFDEVWWRLSPILIEVRHECDTDPESFYSKKNSGVFWMFQIRILQKHIAKALQHFGKGHARRILATTDVLIVGPWGHVMKRKGNYQEQDTVSEKNYHAILKYKQTQNSTQKAYV